jgi:NAD(P)H-dependent FMN reductase
MTGPESRRFLFVVGSAREGGSSEVLARHAAAGLPATVVQDWKRLSDLPLDAFREDRHGETARLPSGNERILLDATLRATDLVIVSPLYWYSVSASVKLYLDHWGRWMRLPAVAFRARMRGKTMWAVTAFGGPDATGAGPLTEALRRSAEYLDMRWGGAVAGHRERPGGDGSSWAAKLVDGERLFRTEVDAAPGGTAAGTGGNRSRTW